MANRNWGKAFAITSFLAICAIVGEVGYIKLNNFTNGKPIEVYALHEMAGRNEIERTYALEKQATDETIENMQNEKEYLRSELASRGEVVEREKKRKETIIRVMNRNLGGKLKGKGQVIYEASMANKYPAYLQCAIIIHETGNGTSKAVRDLNNVGGIFAGSKLKWYKSVDGSIWDMAKKIKKYYIDEGRTSIEAFGRKYCPEGAKNDPTGLNRHWIPIVTRNYIKMINESSGMV